MCLAKRGRSLKCAFVMCPAAVFHTMFVYLDKSHHMPVLPNCWTYRQCAEEGVRTVNVAGDGVAQVIPAHLQCGNTEQKPEGVTT
jgi:hypothetical protein